MYMLSQNPLKLSQNDFTVRINVLIMTFPPRKKRRYIEKTPGGEVVEIRHTLDDLRYHYEELEEPFRMRGID